MVRFSNKLVLVLHVIALLSLEIGTAFAQAQVVASYLPKSDFFNNVAYDDRGLSLYSFRRGKRLLAFGDYSETPESCPARTTCPLVCVANETDCPTSCDAGLILCPDGSCSMSCHNDLESPCSCDELSFACAKVIDYFERCKTTFEQQYADEAECLENQEDSIQQVSFTGTVFILCYSWISAVTVLVILWCAFNQQISPVPESVQPMTHISMRSINGEVDTTESSSDSAGMRWTQTGYKKHFVGSIIFYLVFITIWGIQFILLVLTVMYYMQQEAIKRWSPVFYDEVQVLKAFEIVWVVGFIWTILFQYPATIESLFLRRCRLYEASHVFVVAPMKTIEKQTTDATKISFGDILSRMILFPFDVTLRTIFSYPKVDPDCELIICKVDSVATSIRSFYCRTGRYIFDEMENMYIPGTMNIVDNTTIFELLQLSGGLSQEQAMINYHLVGPNVIALEKPTIRGSIFKEFNKSFYVYQNFMVWTWFPYWYYYMALVNTIIRVAGGLVAASFQHTSDTVLYNLSRAEGEVEVLRDNNRKLIPVREIVPGDVVVLKPGITFCDMAIIKAEHVTVDEASLTGETTPTVKTAFDSTLYSNPYDSKLHNRHTIFAGTIIIENSNNEDDLGLVLTTGPFTTKGKLLCEVLSYQRHKFQFDDQVQIVLAILFVQAVILITIVFHWLQDQFVYAFFYGAFILAACLPPLLPTVFVVSVGISANRLQKRRITCINPQGILVAGKVNVCCFDKTGTMTEPGMDFVGTDCNNSDELSKLLSIGMSVCHSLKVSSNGELIGNHVDRASLAASGGEIHYQKGGNVTIHKDKKVYNIVKHFDFDNHRQTQSVIVKFDDGSLRAFVKGSPEAISALCKQQSIPGSFTDSLQNGARSGMYQLALAYKEVNAELELETIHRADVEANLSFIGFVSFRNILKKETPGIISELKEGNFLLTMITGDNVRAGIHIARQSGLCDNGVMILGQLDDDAKSVVWVDADKDFLVEKPNTAHKQINIALTGEAWASLLSKDYEYALQIAKHVRVFGRCKPEDKVKVVTTLVQLGFITLMCGDGQNDCGALKSAHVGIALGNSDASFVAPFTSLDRQVSSVVEVLREGRCALSSAFKAYSYYIIYGQIESYLQTINAYLHISFADFCWVFLDGVWSASIAFSLPLAHAARKLHPRRPTASLLGPRTLFSVCGMLAINFVFIVIAFATLNHQDWYQCRKWNSTDVSNINGIGDNYESSLLFVVGGYQYVASAIALNFGYTFRAPWYTNTIFVLLSFTWTLFQVIMTLYPSIFSCIWRVNCDNSNAIHVAQVGGLMPIQNAFNTTVMPVPFRIILIVLLFSNLACLCIWEYIFVNGYLYKTRRFGKDDPLRVSQHIHSTLFIQTNTGNPSSS